MQGAIAECPESDKEWLNIEELLKNNYRWSAACNHKPYSQKDGVDIKAFCVIQDANMGGTYWRVYMYIGDNLQRFMTIKDKNCWSVCPSIKEGQIVSLMGKSFKCVQSSRDGFIKAFEFVVGGEVNYELE